MHIGEYYFLFEILGFRFQVSGFPSHACREASGGGAFDWENDFIVRHLLILQLSCNQDESNGHSLLFLSLSLISLSHIYILKLTWHMHQPHHFQAFYELKGLAV